MILTKPKEFKDINELRQYLAEDFCRFIHYVVTRASQWPVPDFHYVMADFMQGKLPRWRSRKKLLLGFRLAAKSWLLRQYIRWRWLRNPNLQVVIHSSTDPIARRMARALLKELREDPVTAFLAPENGESESEFNLRGIEPEVGSSLRVAGIKTSITSSRTDIYAFDDPEPDDNPEALRPHILQVIEEAGHILHTPERHLQFWKDRGASEIPHQERTQLIVIGQPHFEGTAYLPSPEDDEEEGGGHPLADAAKLTIPVLKSETEWMWPDMMHSKYWNAALNRPETIDEVRRGIRRHNWECQMMINPLYATRAGTVIDPSTIIEETRRISRGFLIIDPADGGNCEWGWAIIGIGGAGLHVKQMGGIEGEAYEGDDDESLGESVWRRIFDIADSVCRCEVLIEANLKAAITAARRFVRKTGDARVIHEHRASRNKLRRIVDALEQPFRNGMVTLDPSVLKDPRNRRQLFGLRYSKLPTPCDRIDALGAGVAHLIDTYGHAIAGQEASDRAPVRTTDGYVVPDTLGSVNRITSNKSPMSRIARRAG